ncbi:MAG: hypothetical protein ACRYG8_06080 [Janthinobacterium lividum]
MSKQPLSSLSSIMPAKGEAAKTETLPEEAPRLVKPPKEERHGLTIRVRNSHNERLRTMVYREGMTKQDLLDRAIEEMLERYGY